MKKLVYYCDMDGVLADFNSELNATLRFRHELDFFKKLKPIQDNVKAIRDLIKRGNKVFIITTSPNKNADFSKRVWLARYLPEVKKNRIIFTRETKNKIDYVPKRLRGKAILFDDYSLNLKKWIEGGGRIAIKIIGEKNPKKDYQFSQIKNIQEWVNL